MNITIVKDTFFSTKKWFIEMASEGKTVKLGGFTTKKAAEQLCDDIVPEWRKIPKWNTDNTGKVNGTYCT
jgi:hypothetical protein